MADVLISQLPVASSVNTSDLIIVDQNISGVLTTKTATIAQLIGLPVIASAINANTIATQALDANGYSAEFTSYNGSGALVPNSSTAFKSSRGTSALPLATVAGDVIGNDDYFGFNGAAFAYAASLDIVAAANFTNINTPTQFNVNVTAPGATAPTLAATIGQGITINTLTPSYYALSCLVNNNVVNGSGIQLGGGRGTQAAPTAVQANDILGNVDFFGYGTSYVEGAAIDAIAGSTWTATNAETSLTFFTTPAASVIPTQKMALMGNGTLMVGTASYVTGTTTGSTTFPTTTSGDTIVTNGGVMSLGTEAQGAYNFTGLGYSAANNNNASIGLKSQTRGASPTLAGDTLGNIDMFGWTGAVYGYAASIDCVANATWTTISTPTQFNVNLTSIGSITPVNAMTVYPNGGISLPQIGGIIGMNGTTSASTGYVGEVVSSVVAPIATGLTSATVVNVTSIALTAGDWDVFGSFVVTGAATTSFTNAAASISVTSLTQSATNLTSFNATAAFVPGGTFTADNVPTQRLLITVPTTVYLIASSAFTVSTAGVGGTIYARRAR
jgi:hypothetical protein